jgi:hypothetical protein
MTDYSAILESETDPAAPSKSSLWKRWAKNWIAGFEGAVGAPRLYGEAVAYSGNGLPVLTVSAADTYSLTEGAGPVSGTLSTTSTSDVMAQRWTISTFSGVVRARASHNVTVSGNTSTLTLFKNGVSVQAFTQSVTTPAARVVDVAVSVGDVLEWRHRTNANSSVVSAVSLTASNAYIAQSAFRKAV